MKKLIIVDFYNLLYRSHFGFGSQLINSKGLLVNAIHGFVKTILKLEQDFSDYKIICALESGSNWRMEIYNAYKSGRKPMPEELKVQIPIIMELLTQLGIQVIKKEMYEADDIMAYLSQSELYEEIIIVSSDKDLLQLVSPKVLVFDMMKNTMYNEEEVKNRYQLTPRQIVDYLSLLGDKSDNVPGALGVGEKSALSLMMEYGSIPSIYANIDKIKGALGKKLEASKENVELSYVLINLLKPFDIDVEIQDQASDRSMAKKTLLSYELYQLASRIK